MTSIACCYTFKKVASVPTSIMKSMKCNQFALPPPCSMSSQALVHEKRPLGLIAHDTSVKLSVLEVKKKETLAQTGYDPSNTSTSRPWHGCIILKTTSHVYSWVSLVITKLFASYRTISKHSKSEMSTEMIYTAWYFGAWLWGFPSVHL